MTISAKSRLLEKRFDILDIIIFSCGSVSFTAGMIALSIWLGVIE